MIERALGAGLILFLALCSGNARADQTESTASFSVAGRVFEDLNLNGSYDEGEPGIEGVPISDQVVVVSTDAQGEFRFQSDAAFGLVFMSQPSHYKASGLVWRKIAAESEKVYLQFPLVAVEWVEDFSFIHASDPHLSDETLPRVGLLREVVLEQQPAFVLLTGDLIDDALRVGEAEATVQYELLMRELAEFPVPVWTALGNHEIFGIERHKSLVSPEHPLYGKEMYRHYLGPNYYSFDFAGVHFVCLDTVGIKDLWYFGHVDPVQLAWLRQDLEEVDPDATVVSFSHIPLVSAGPALFGYDEDLASPSFVPLNGKSSYRHIVGNAEEVLSYLRERKNTLALAGHFHAREQLIFETRGLATRFHLAAAVKGDHRNALGMRMVSGVTLYSVSTGVIDNGTFLPLD